MLAGVLHKELVPPNDQFPLVLSPHHTKCAPTDLHLREFAQLEVQVKALQIPAINSRTSAARLAECFHYYSRLFTVESFLWPDFLAVVFTKLAEHFAASENIIVQSAILRVFQRAKGHVAQVNDPSKLLGHLMGPLLHATACTARTMALQILATMPSLLLENTTVQQQLIKGIKATNWDERMAAIETVRALLPLQPSFQKDVLTATLEDKTTETCCLAADAVTTSIEAHKVWTYCAEFYERLASDKNAVACVRAMTKLCAAYPDTLLAMHGQVLHHILNHDPRPFIQNFALLITQQLVVNDGKDRDNEELIAIIEGIFSNFSNHFDKWKLRHQLSALLLLEKWSAGYEVGNNAVMFLEIIKTVLTTTADERFGRAYTCIISNIAQQTLIQDHSTAFENHIDELLRLLRPRATNIATFTWGHALSAISRLCQEFSVRLTPLVTSRLIELFSILADAKVDQYVAIPRRNGIMKVLGAQAQPPPINLVHQALPMLLQELSTIDQTDANRMQALARTFFLWTHELVRTPLDPDHVTSQTIRAFEEQLITFESDKSHAERYEMAKIAMLRGRFSLAKQWLSEVAAMVSSECFGGWLHALLTLCEAESRIANHQSVDLESLHTLTCVREYLQAARTPLCRFDFQLHFVAARLRWLQLVQNAQQFAGEMAYTNAPGHVAGREGTLSTQFRALAHQYDVLRTMLLGANQSDLDSLQFHVQLCLLLAQAVEGLMLLQPIDSIDFAVTRGSCIDTSHWSLQVVTELSESVREKLHRVAQLSPLRQASVGARILQQLLVVLCALPNALPPLFFRSRLGRKQRLQSSAQFLTFAENATFTTKPRPRSQLGVSLGTDFVSVLKGVLAVPIGAQSYWQKRIEAVEAEVLVYSASVDDSDNSSSYECMEATASDKLVHYRVTTILPICWQSVKETASGNDRRLYAPFEMPVHVAATRVAVKGSFVLVAKLKVVDPQGEKWLLAATGCRRGFIVY